MKKLFILFIFCYLSKDVYSTSITGVQLKEKIANWLDSLEEVSWVNYPGLQSSKFNSLAKKYLPNGQSGLVTFGVKGGYDHAKKISDNTKIFSLLANIGDSKSLIIHPASTTHSQLSEDEQLQTGVSRDLIRLSIGLENFDDLKNDLENAIKII